MRRLLGVVLGVSSISMLVACAQQEHSSLIDDISSGHVTIGTAFSAPGLSSRGEDGSVTGLDISVATYVVNAIADAHGWKQPTIEWRTTPPAQRESLLDNGYVSMVASTYSMTAKRTQKVDFAGPYLLTHQAVLVNADNPLTDMADLDEETVCFVTGTTAGNNLREAKPDVTMAEYDSYGACLDALAAGHVDAVTTDGVILNGFAAQHPGTTRVIALEKDGEPISDEHYGIGVRRGDNEAVAAINDALGAMYDDGSFDRFVEANLATDPAAVRDNPGDLSFLTG